MLAYYILFSLIVILSTLNIGVVYKTAKSDAITARKKTYVTEVFILLTLFMGLRATTVGVDIHQYAFHYNNADDFFAVGFKNSEWGYNYIAYFFHDIIKVDFQVFLFVLSLIFAFALTRCVYQYSDNPLLSFIVYLTIGNFTLSLSGLRQTLAISLILIAIVQAEKRKLIKFLLLVFAASIVHNSAIIFLPIYLLWGRRLTRLQAFISLGVTVAAFLYKDALVPVIEFLAPERYDDIDITQGSDINLLVIAVPLIMTLFSAIFTVVDDSGKLSEKQSFFFIMSCLNIFMLILSLNHNQLGRLSYYFSIGNAFLLPAVLKDQQKLDERVVKIIEIAIAALCLLYFFISAPGGTLQIDNYKFFWQS